jgi:hypothetical protein
VIENISDLELVSTEVLTRTEVKQQSDTGSIHMSIEAKYLTLTIYVWEITVILVSSTSTIKSDSVDISSDIVSAISDFSCSGITSGITTFSASTESLMKTRKNRNNYWSR